VAGTLAVVGGAQHAQDASQIARRLAADRKDRSQCLARLLGALVHHVSRHAGLHVDRREAERHDVVQLTRDAEALRVDKSTRRFRGWVQDAGGR
jgi:hypothetical protein